MVGFSHESSVLAGKTFPLVEKFFPTAVLYPSHQAFEPHWHEELEILYVVSGELICHFEHKSLRLKKRDIVVINPNVLHSGHAVPGQRVDYYTILVHSRILSTAGFLPVLDTNSNYVLDPILVCNDDANHDFLENCIQRVIQESENKNTGYENAICNWLNLLYIPLERQYPKYDAHRQQVKHQLAQFERLFQYVEKHYRETITVDMAASLLTMSRFYFCRVFKKNTGYTFVEYLNRYRVQIAEKLLGETSKPISDVAELVGLADSSYFTKVFEKYMQVSPSEYRKKVRGHLENQV